MDKEIISNCKKFIQDNDIDALKEYSIELVSLNQEYGNWEYIFQQVYLHACLKKRKDVAEWLTSLYNEFDPIDQIALRQTFAYGKYLLNK